MFTQNPPLIRPKNQHIVGMTTNKSCYAVSIIINGKLEEKMKYRVHRFNLKMTEDRSKLDQFLNSL